MTEHLYRAFGTVTWTETTFARTGAIVSIMIDKITIIRRTPKGAWIIDPITLRERWVSTEGRKRFACPTKEEAIESLKHRNRKRMAHLKNAMDKCEAIAETMDGDYKVTELSNGLYTMGIKRNVYDRRNTDLERI